MHVRPPTRCGSLQTARSCSWYSLRELDRWPCGCNDRKPFSQVIGVWRHLRIGGHPMVERYDHPARACTARGELDPALSASDRAISTIMSIDDRDRNKYTLDRQPNGVQWGSGSRDHQRSWRSMQRTVRNSSSLLVEGCVSRARLGWRATSFRQSPGSARDRGSNAWDPPPEITVNTVL